MNEHDRDLILGLTEGNLTADEAAAARARIAADPDLTAELAAQEAMRSELMSLPAVTLTDAERSSLRAGLMAELHLEDAPAIATEPAARRRLAWWQPVLGVATVAAVVTAVVILPNTLGGSDDAGDSEALAVSTTVAAVAEDGSAGADAPDGPTLEVLSFDGVDGSELLEDAGTADTPEEVTDSIERENRTLARTSVGITEAEACLEQLGDQIPPGDKTLIGADETEEGLLVYFAVIDEGGLESVVTVNLDECRVVDIDP